MAAEGLVGKWKSVGFKNIELFWDAMGVPDAMRKFAKETKTELTIEKESGGWKLTTVAGDKHRVVTFPVGQEVDTITMMGEPCKAVLTEESDGSLLERQKGPKGDITIQRFLIDGKLETNLTLNGVTAVIKFEKA